MCRTSMPILTCRMKYWLRHPEKNIEAEFLISVRCLHNNLVVYLRSCVPVAGLIVDRGFGLSLQITFADSAEIDGIIPIINNFCARHKSNGKCFEQAFHQDKQIASRHRRLHAKHHNFHNCDSPSNGCEGTAINFQQDSTPDCKQEVLLW